MYIGFTYMSSIINELRQSRFDLANYMVYTLDTGREKYLGETEMIEYSFERDERMGWSTHMIRANGETVCGITDMTDRKAVEKFVSLCRQRDEELCEVCSDVKERREWNMNNPGKGKDWPVFKIKERLVKALLKEAGIKNT